MASIVRSAAAKVKQQFVRCKPSQRVRRERGTLRRKLSALEADLGRLATAELPSDIRMRRLVEVQDQSREVQRRLATVESKVAKLESEQVSDAEVKAALADFDGVWEALQPREQARAIELLVESITWDGEAESVSITFRPTGIKSLAAREEAA
jgi:hypothetical protein